MAAVEEEAVTGGVEKSLVVVLVTGILWAVGEAGGVVWVALVACSSGIGVGDDHIWNQW